MLETTAVSRDDDCADFDAERFARRPPFPWFGGKSKAAPAVWNALGDVHHYVEPFAGGLGVLLNRPHPCNRPYHSETINDLDGFVVNAWRAIAWAPDAVAEAASWPVTEADMTARQIALLKWRDEHAAEKLAGSAEWFDARMAGWWLWAIAVSIATFDEKGRWTACPTTGRIVKMPTNDRTRQPGVARQRPSLISNGRGVCQQTLREPGVADDNGNFHEMTMPRLRMWMRLLSARLRHVRILNGDWSRVCTESALRTLSIRERDGVCGVFLDPPYSENVRSQGLYMHDSGTVSHNVRQWCIENSNKPWLRIVLAGMNDEHDELLAHGWRKIEWFVRKSMIDGGPSKRGHEERLWLSPHCLREQGDEQQLQLL